MTKTIGFELTLAQSHIKMGKVENYPLCIKKKSPQKGNYIFHLSEYIPKGS